MRLTAGVWRGRKLATPQGIRPTTELARKAAFDILGDAVVGARVLDACAGSGAYGLEALSRGAAHTTFVEADRNVANVLRRNVERLSAGARATIEEMTVTRLSLIGEEGKGRDARVRLSFDVIFHDPPFKENSESSESDLELLLGLVHRGGWLFHERGDDAILRPAGLEPADRRRYGTTRFLIFRP